MEDFVTQACSAIPFCIVFAILAILISATKIDRYIELFPRFKKRRLYLCPQSEDQDIDWAESIIAAEKGRTLDMLRLVEKEPDLIYTSDAAGETVLHVLAKADLGDAIAISTCSTIMEIVGKGRMKRVLLKQNTNGDTPLHLALKAKDHELAYWLVAVDYEAAFVYNKDGVCPYELAQKAGYSKMLRKISIYELRGACSDIELKLVTKDIFNFREPSKAKEWNESIPEHARKAFLKASNGLLKPREIETYIKGCGGNLLHWAANYCRVDVIRLLNKFMTNTELDSLALERNKNGDLPLHLALRWHDKATALHLIEMAPKASYFVTRKGKTPLYMAIKQSCEDLVRRMFQGMPGMAIDSTLRNNLLTENASVVHAAVRCRSRGILDIILNELPDSIDSIDEQGWRPLSYAAYEGNLSAVSYILHNFPNSVAIKDRDGSFPIHKAVGGGHVSIVEQFILSCPSTIYHLDSKGRSILHIAISYAKADVFSYLTKKKEVEQIFHHQDHEGKTFVDLVY